MDHQNGEAMAHIGVRVEPPVRAHTSTHRSLLQFALLILLLD